MISLPRNVSSHWLHLIQSSSRLHPQFQPANLQYITSPKLNNRVYYSLLHEEHICQSFFEYYLKNIIPSRRFTYNFYKIMVKDTPISLIIISRTLLIVLPWMFFTFLYAICRVFSNHFNFILQISVHERSILIDPSIAQGTFSI